MFQFDDTIVAIASAAGGAARGVVRMSGPTVVACLGRCFQSDNGCRLADFRRASVISGVLSIAPPVGDLPCDVYLWPDARSYTGQPAAEIHTLGSPPLLEAALRTLCQSGARLAEPGEFTLRAFLAGRLDLTQAESVLGAIDARGQQELNVALAQLAGGLSAPLGRLRDELLELLAHLEAGLDFVDEDIEFISAEQLDRQLTTAAGQVGGLVEQMAGRSESGGEFRIALVGWPNVGKSSLFNALVRRSAAIVADREGTTRDYLSARLSIGEFDCLLIDTAGVTAAERPPGVDELAQVLTAEQSKHAHLQLLCIDGTRPLNQWERSQLVHPPHESIVVLTKSDARGALRLDVPAVATSARMNQGLDDLRGVIRQRLSALVTQETHVVAATAVRCRESLRLASQRLEHARELAVGGLGEELVAAEIRVALDELGKVVGAVYTDDILDRIFSRFCIGK